MDASTVANVLSAGFSGGSVLFAVHTYRRADFSNNVAKLRSALELSIVQLQDVGSMLQERFVNQLGVQFAKEMAATFGLEQTVESLRRIMTVKNDSSDNLIMRAFYEAYERTDAAKKIDAARKSAALASTAIRRFSPAIAFYYSKLATASIRTVESTYSLDPIRKVVLDGEGRDNLFDTAISADCLTHVYSEIGEVFASFVTYAGKEHSSKIFAQEYIMFSILSSRLIQLPDREVGSLSKRFSQTFSELTERDREIKSRVGALEVLYRDFADFFSVSEREQISSSLGSMRQLLPQRKP